MIYEQKIWEQNKFHNGNKFDNTKIKINFPYHRMIES